MPVSTKFSDAERHIVLDEMNSIVDDPTFSSCKRCVKLFRHLIEGTLDGNPDSFKERTLGIEVFGRDANYDTNADPVVRMAASEIRKRLAHIYQDPEHEHSVTIRLIPGSYVPDFEFDSEFAIEEPASTLASATLPGESAPPSIGGESIVAKVTSLPVWQSWPLRTAVLLFVATGIAAFGAYRHSRLPKSPQWDPLLKSPASLLICLSDSDPLETANLNDLVSQDNLLKGNPASLSPLVNSGIGPFHRITFEEVKAFYKVSDLLIRDGKSIKFRPCSALTLRDFHGTGAIVIGGADNPWSTHMLSNLRFSLHFDPRTRDRWIQDAQNPSKREWKIDGGNTQDEFDYAVIARFFNQETEQWVLVLAGLFPYGTESASDLMTDPMLAQLIPKSINSRNNFEMVVQTPIVNQVAGHPVIVAVHTW